LWSIFLDILSPSQYIQLIATNLETIGGQVIFTKENVAVLPTCLAQWVKGKKFLFEFKLVSNGNYKFMRVQGKLLSIWELRGMK
jgi:hypothetical protein